MKGNYSWISEVWILLWNQKKTYQQISPLRRFSRHENEYALIRSIPLVCIRVLFEVNCKRVFGNPSAMPLSFHQLKVGLSQYFSLAASIYGQRIPFQSWYFCMTQEPATPEFKANRRHSQIVMNEVRYLHQVVDSSNAMCVMFLQETITKFISRSNSPPTNCNGEK